MAIKASNLTFKRHHKCLKILNIHKTSIIVEVNVSCSCCDVTSSVGITWVLPHHPARMEEFGLSRKEKVARFTTLSAVTGSMIVPGLISTDLCCGTCYSHMPLGAPGCRAPIIWPVPALPTERPEVQEPQYYSVIVTIQSAFK